MRFAGSGSAAKCDARPRGDGRESLSHFHRRGVLALGGAIYWAERPAPGSALIVMTLATAVATGAMMYTGLLGGRVRYTEVRLGAVEADAITIEPPRQRPPGAMP